MDDLIRLRNEIDGIDSQLFDLLEQRFALSEKIKVVKQQSNILVADPSREQKILSRINQYPHGCEIKKLYLTLFQLSKEIQEKMI